MRGSIKDAPAEKPRCMLDANIALTTDYISRGFSQSGRGAAVQGGFDATCGMLYAGVWGSSIDFGGEASLEIDARTGVTLTAGGITWEVGVIYTAYPNHVSGIPNPNYVEFKVGATGKVWKDATLGAVAFFAPDYSYEVGRVWTLEATYTQPLPKVGGFSSSFSALLGYQTGEDAAWKATAANGRGSYTYWNAGLTFTFMENWSFDVRYWDTNIPNNGKTAGFCDGTATNGLSQCNERVVGTLAFTY